MPRRRNTEVVFELAGEPDPRFIGCTTLDEVIERMNDDERAALDAARERVRGHLWQSAIDAIEAERAAEQAA